MESRKIWTVIRRHRWSYAASRGSILIACYLVVAFCLALAIPQTTRSMSALQLETRGTEHQQLFELAQAGLAHGISILRNPLYAELGDYNDRGPAGAQAAGSDYPCAPWDLYWRCWKDPVTNSQVIAGPGGTYTVKAADVWMGGYGTGKSIVSGQYKYRRQMVVEATLDRTKDKLVCDAVLDIVRKPAATNPDGSVVGFERVRVGSGATLKGDVEIYGASSGRYKTKFLWINNDAVVEGKVTVGHAGQVMPTSPLPPDPNTRLCCGKDDAIRIGSTGKIVNGKLTVADTTGVLQTTDPYAPGWRVDADGNLLGKPNPLATTYPSVCSSTPPVHIVSSSDTDTFCLEGESCEFPIGKENGSWVDYCFAQLDVRKLATARFQGQNVLIIAKGTTTSSTNPPDGIKVGTSATLFSYPTGMTTPNPSTDHTRLELHIAKGTYESVRVMGKARLYGSIFAPKSLVSLGARTETDTTDPADQEELTDDEIDPPLDGAGDDLDPDSQVDVEGFVQGRLVYLRSKAVLNMRVKQGSQGNGPADDNEPGNGVLVLGTRCYRKK